MRVKHILLLLTLFFDPRKVSQHTPPLPCFPHFRGKAMVSPMAMKGRYVHWQILTNIDQTSTTNDKNWPFFKRACRNFEKCSAIKRHKWYWGVPIHIKLILIISNVLFIGIIFNWYILLVLNRPCRAIILPCLFPYGAAYVPTVRYCLPMSISSLGPMSWDLGPGWAWHWLGPCHGQRQSIGKPIGHQ